ncbi:hypothetical protein CMI47_04440 [Candidatus Pacearchaeota archaeon]|jgi:hypothetical protein|nr:hypothetical protein [Candidatus Pacearchaeota archaeon]|tara:strand:+ start:227 stop:508 length:282 start_codon:yes stop_codon:yes gene_type:complete
MARIIRDIRCNDCLTVTEHWISKEELASLNCPECGSSDMTVMIGAPHFGITASVANGQASSDGMTTGIDKWEKMRKQKQRIEKRNLERHGTYD